MADLSSSLFFIIFFSYKFLLLLLNPKCCPLLNSPPPRSPSLPLGHHDKANIWCICASPCQHSPRAFFSPLVIMSVYVHLSSTLSSYPSVFCFCSWAVSRAKSSSRKCCKVDRMGPGSSQRSGKPLLLAPDSHTGQSFVFSEPIHVCSPSCASYIAFKTTRRVD